MIISLVSYSLPSLSIRTMTTYKIGLVIIMLIYPLEIIPIVIYLLFGAFYLWAKVEDDKY